MRPLCIFTSCSVLFEQSGEIGGRCAATLKYQETFSESMRYALTLGSVILLHVWVVATVGEERTRLGF